MRRIIMKKIYICEHCGNIINKIDDAGVPVMCCGQVMKEVIAGTVEASHEKHIPVVNNNNEVVEVTIGSVEHPMTEEHLIEWVMIETTQGIQIKKLKAGNLPRVEFALSKNDELLSVYAYCNLHGLWKS